MLWQFEGEHHIAGGSLFPAERSVQPHCRCVLPIGENPRLGATEIQSTLKQRGESKSLCATLCLFELGPPHVSLPVRRAVERSGRILGDARWRLEVLQPRRVQRACFGSGQLESLSTWQRRKRATRILLQLVGVKQIANRKGPEAGRDKAEQDEAKHRPEREGPGRKSESSNDEADERLSAAGREHEKTESAYEPHPEGPLRSRQLVVGESGNQHRLRDDLEVRTASPTIPNVAGAFGAALRAEELGLGHGISFGAHNPIDPDYFRTSWRSATMPFL